MDLDKAVKSSACFEETALLNTNAYVDHRLSLNLAGCAIRPAYPHGLLGSLRLAR